MDSIAFKKLQSTVKKPDFGDDFKQLNIILKVLSILGNVASVFLASFFVAQLLSVAVENIYIQWGFSIIALTGLELTKREIFFRFSRDFIRTKSIFKKTVLPMLFSTMVLIALSFYSSLSGAQEFSSKSEIIETEALTFIDNFTDSTNSYYQEKIDVLEKQNQELFDANKKIDEQVDVMLLDHPTWVSTAKKMREPQQVNNIQIEKNDDKIKEIKSERDEVIEKYKTRIDEESNEQKDKNQNDSFIFIMTSTLIEFLILIGIYFNNLYNFRSYRDIKHKLLHDDNFRTYHDYCEIIDVLYLNRKDKDKIPDIDLMVKLLVMNKVYLSKKQVEEALTLFDALKIVETNDGHTYLLKDKDEAMDEMSNHFHIKK